MNDTPPYVNVCNLFAEFSFVFSSCLRFHLHQTQKMRFKWKENKRKGDTLIHSHILRVCVRVRVFVWMHSDLHWFRRQCVELMCLFPFFFCLIFSNAQTHTNRTYIWREPICMNSSLSLFLSVPLSQRRFLSAQWVKLFYVYYTYIWIIFCRMSSIRVCASI